MIPQEQVIAEVVKAYLDQTARPHTCVGFDCKVCSLNGDRFVEVQEEIRRSL